MYLRKRNNKWQCLVRLKGVSISQSFWSKTDARLWGQKTEVDISNGGYLKNLKLVEMRLKDLLQLYLEKALHKSKRPKILKYDVELMRRMPLARYTLVQLSPVKIAEFRDDRLKAGKSTTTCKSFFECTVSTIRDDFIGLKLSFWLFQIHHQSKLLLHEVF